MDLFFGTTNQGKLEELRRLVAGLAVRVVSPDELGRPLPEVEETGATFEENAHLKAVASARLTGLHALADDSGLCVDALGGAPGVHSARFSADQAPGRLPREERDRLNNQLLLQRLGAAPPGRRGAEYLAVLVVAAPDGRVVASVTGRCRGRIGTAPRGTGGFGYDPLFTAAAEEARAAAAGRPARTMAELSAEEKDALSHRGEAMRALRPALERLAGAAGGGAAPRPRGGRP
jgi:XTP/dITP diphosphohydrolase